MKKLPIVTCEKWEYSTQVMSTTNETTCTYNLGPNRTDSLESHNEMLDSPTLGIVYAVILSVLGLVGAALNIVVIYGVSGNARLGTTVNKLLIWICGFALLEGTVGVLMKVLILGKF